MRILSVGAGYIGPVNTRALMACEGVEIAGVCNRTESRAIKLCADLGLSCPVYTELDRALDEVRPDACLISVFNDLHRPYFLSCAARGIHVLVEKPLGNTPEECEEMIAAAKLYGIRATVLHTQRYGSVLMTAADWLREHGSEPGRLMSITDEISCNYFWEGRNPWHLDHRRSGGGIVLNYGVHQLDRVHYFLGQKTAEFHAVYRREKPGVETCSSYAMLGRSGGGIPYLISCTGYAGPSSNAMTLYYENGTLRCRLVSNGEEEKGVWLGDTASGVFRPLPLIAEDGEGGRLMYERQMQEAVSYLTGERETPPVSLEWAAEMVRLACLGFRETEPAEKP